MVLFNVALQFQQQQNQHRCRGGSALNGSAKIASLMCTDCIPLLCVEAQNYLSLAKKVESSSETLLVIIKVL